ncbi:formate/nitrite transporter family protein, partial [Sulfurovum sp. bin170]|uniref:formate/nitrite transporter family protein n=1 Tax=Sulfurovum sp. bin170 TaxID=2695268 RepID=UPI0013E025DA
GIGDYKVKMPTAKVLVSGFLAGAYIAFAAQLMTTVTHDMTGVFGAGFTSFIGGGVFGIALVLVLVAGSDLFTGNTMLSMGWLNGNLNTKQVLNNWMLVYIGNFIGAMFLVWLIYNSSMWDAHGGQVGANAVTLAYKKVHLTFTEAFIRGIACNWLVCLAVIMVVSAKDTMGKILGAWFPVMAFIASGFEHCVANMFIIPAGITASLDPTVAEAVMLTHPTWDLATLNTSSFIFGNLIPVTLGNIFSGAVLVGGIYWFLYVKEENKEYRHLTIKTETFRSFFTTVSDNLVRQYRYIKIMMFRYTKAKH